MTLKICSKEALGRYLINFAATQDLDISKKFPTKQHTNIPLLFFFTNVQELDS